MAQTLINVEDLFIPEFVEYCTIAGRQVQCISTEISLDEVVSEIGAADEFDLALMFRISQAKPAEGSVLTFRGTVYRVARIIEDSIAATYRAYLRAEFGGVR
jgi:hypothetical protein